MTSHEFTRTVRARPHPPETIAIEADEAELAALAERVGVSAVHALRAELAFAQDGSAVEARGIFAAAVDQPCAVSGEDFAVRIEEPLHLRFVTQLRECETDEEIELAADEPDEIEFDGENFDIGEAVAQSLSLAIDPFARGPDADAVRRAAGIVDEDTPRGPLADALAALRKA